MIFMTVLTCSASTEGRVSVITFDVSAIFRFLPLLFAVNEGLSFNLQDKINSHLEVTVFICRSLKTSTCFQLNTTFIKDK